MLELHRQLAATRTSHEMTALGKGRTKAANGQVDALVYELCDQTEEEILNIFQTCLSLDSVGGQL